MARSRGHQDLQVYQKSYHLALEVHKLTLDFPELGKYEIGKQLREATKSIPANIAEGYGRKPSKADLRRFLVMALGSCDEVQVWLSFARDLEYLPSKTYQGLEERYQEVGRMLSGLIKSYTSS